MLLKSLLTTITAATLASAQSCSFGSYQCSGQSLQQCSYGAGNALSWGTIQTCATGTVCTVGSYVGCLPGQAGTATTATTTKVATTTKPITSTTTTTTTKSKTTASASNSVQTTATTTVGVKTSTTAAATTTTSSGGNIPPLPAVKKISYIDNTAGALTGASYNVPGYANNDYNIINIGFWLDQGGWDTGYTWTQLDDATRQSYIDAYHAAGKRVLIAAYGAAEWPTLNGVNPTKSAQDLAAFVKKYGFDGADIDYEDNNSFSAGTAEAWLITFSKELRAQLPSPRYTISHAPQAPYFINNRAIYPNGGYLAVHAAVGDLIDFYNVQFYNQGPLTAYNTCETLLNKSGGDWPGTSLFEIAANGIPLSKLIIGKPITSGDATNTGYTSPATLASCVQQAKSKGWNTGVFGWQFKSDPSGSWIAQVAGGL